MTFTTITILMTAVALLLLGLSTLFFAECVFGRRHMHRLSASADELVRSEDFIVLMPAHDEAEIIGDTLSDLARHLRDISQVLVVADNCSDDTAKIAREMGASVLERHNTEHRGKGFALAHGLEEVFKRPQKNVIVLDADCHVEGDCLAVLAGTAQEMDRPVQANNVLKAVDDEKFATRIALFAWRVKNYLRPMGLQHFGLPCQLMGTGMAFPKRLLQGVNLATGNIVEDIQLGLDLAAAGKAPLLQPNATIWSLVPVSDTAVNTQRTRWEHGHLATILNSVPRALWRGITGRNLPLVSLALDLAIPPLTLLAMLLAAQLLITAGMLLVGATLPFTLALSALLMLSGAIGIGWHTVGKPYIDKADLWNLFRYALGKLSIYRRFFLRNKAQTWVRTERN